MHAYIDAERGRTAFGKEGHVGIMPVLALPSQLSLLGQGTWRLMVSYEGGPDMAVSIGTCLGV